MTDAERARELEACVARAAVLVDHLRLFARRHEAELRTSLRVMDQVPQHRPRPVMQQNALYGLTEITAIAEAATALLRARK
jgi:hypothetical protein